MTKQAIEARIVELRASLEQKMAEVNALIGAINDCEYWLAQVAAEETPADGPHAPEC